MSEVTRPTVPDGMVDLLRGLATNVLREKPENIYVFAAEYFENLLRERDGSLDKGYEKFREYDKRMAELKRGKDSTSTDEVGNDKSSKGKSKQHIPPVDMGVNGVAMQVNPRENKLKRLPSNRKKRLENSRSDSQDSTDQEDGAGTALREKMTEDELNDEVFYEKKELETLESVDGTVAQSKRIRKLSSKKPSQNLIAIKEEVPVEETEARGSNGKSIGRQGLTQDAAAFIIQNAIRNYVTKKKVASEPATPTNDDCTENVSEATTVIENLEVQTPLSEHLSSGLGSEQESVLEDGFQTIITTEPDENDTSAENFDDGTEQIETVDVDAPKMDRLRTPESDSGLSEKSFNLKVHEAGHDNSVDFENTSGNQNEYNIKAEVIQLIEEEKKAEVSGSNEHKDDNTNEQVKEEKAPESHVSVEESFLKAEINESKSQAKRSVDEKSSDGASKEINILEIVSDANIQSEDNAKADKNDVKTGPTEITKDIGIPASVDTVNAHSDNSVVNIAQKADQAEETHHKHNDEIQSNAGNNKTNDDKEGMVKPNPPNEVTTKGNTLDNKTEVKEEAAAIVNETNTSTEHQNNEHDATKTGKAADGIPKKDDHISLVETKQQEAFPTGREDTLSDDSAKIETEEQFIERKISNIEHALEQLDETGVGEQSVEELRDELEVLGDAAARVEEHIMSARTTDSEEGKSINEAVENNEASEHLSGELREPKPEVIHYIENENEDLIQNATEAEEGTTTSALLKLNLATSDPAENSESDTISSPKEFVTVVEAGGRNIVETSRSYADMSEALKQMVESEQLQNSDNVATEVSIGGSNNFENGIHINRPGTQTGDSKITENETKNDNITEPEISDKVPLHEAEEVSPKGNKVDKKPSDKINLEDESSSNTKDQDEHQLDTLSNADTIPVTDNLDINSIDVHKDIDGTDAVSPDQTTEGDHQTIKHEIEKASDQAMNDHLDSLSILDPVQPNEGEEHIHKLDGTPSVALSSGENVQEIDTETDENAKIKSNDEIQHVHSIIENEINNTVIPEPESPIGIDEPVIVSKEVSLLHATNSDESANSIEKDKEEQSIHIASENDKMHPSAPPYHEIFEHLMSGNLPVEEFEPTAINIAAEKVNTEKVSSEKSEKTAVDTEDHLSKPEISSSDFDDSIAHLKKNIESEPPHVIKNANENQTPNALKAKEATTTGALANLNLTTSDPVENKKSDNVTDPKELITVAEVAGRTILETGRSYAEMSEVDENRVPDPVDLDEKKELATEKLVGLENSTVKSYYELNEKAKSDAEIHEKDDEVLVKSADKEAVIGQNTMDSSNKSKEITSKNLELIKDEEMIDDKVRTDIHATKGIMEANQLQGDLSEPKNQIAVETIPKNPRPGESKEQTSDPSIAEAQNEVKPIDNATKTASATSHSQADLETIRVEEEKAKHTSKDDDLIDKQEVALLTEKLLDAKASNESEINDVLHTIAKREVEDVDAMQSDDEDQLQPDSLDVLKSDNQSVATDSLMDIKRENDDGDELEDSLMDLRGLESLKMDIEDSNESRHDKDNVKHKPNGKSNIDGSKIEGISRRD